MRAALPPRAFPTATEASAPASDQRPGIDRLTDAIITTDGSFRVTGWSHGAETIYGWTQEEAVGRLVNELVQTAWETNAARQASIDRLRATGRWCGEVVQTHRDGQSLRVLSSVSMIRDANGAPEALVAVNRDLTAQRQAEVALAQVGEHRSQPPAEVQASIAGLVDQYNNLLGVITGSAELALHLLPPDHPARLPLAQVLSGADQGAEVTRALQALCPRPAPAPAPPAAPDAQAPKRGPLRILLAEDQEMVREVLSELLRALGHEVTAVIDGQAAVEAGARERFDVFVTDVSMPRLNGPGAAAALRLARPDLPLIYLSGFPREERAAEEERWPAGVFRQKPAGLSTLRSALEEALR